MAPKRKLNRGLEALLGTGLLNKAEPRPQALRPQAGSLLLKRRVH